MENNKFDVEILTTTNKKWNLYIIVIIVLLLILCVFSISTKFYIPILIWLAIAGLFLFYEYKHSKSIVELATKLLFNDDGFSIVIDDNNFKLQLKRENITKIRFDKKTNHIMIYQNEDILYQFLVKPKSLLELYDVFSSFDYKCELTEVI